MRASRLNRSATLTLSPSSGGSTFRATARRSPTSVALKITPIPPRASSRSTSYSPASTMRTRWNSASGCSVSTSRVASCGSTAMVPQLAQNRAPSGIAAPQGKKSKDSWQGRPSARNVDRILRGQCRVRDHRADEAEREEHLPRSASDERVADRGQRDDRGVGGGEQEPGARYGDTIGLDRDDRGEALADGERRIPDVTDDDVLQPCRAEDVCEAAGTDREPAKGSERERRERSGWPHDHA